MTRQHRYEPSESQIRVRELLTAALEDCRSVEAHLDTGNLLLSYAAWLHLATRVSEAYETLKGMGGNDLGALGA